MSLKLITLLSWLDFWEKFLPHRVTNLIHKFLKPLNRGEVSLLGKFGKLLWKLELWLLPTLCEVERSCARDNYYLWIKGCQQWDQMELNSVSSPYVVRWEWGINLLRKWKYAKGERFISHSPQLQVPINNHHYFPLSMNHRGNLYMLIAPTS